MYVQAAASMSQNLHQRTYVHLYTLYVHISNVDLHSSEELGHDHRHMHRKVGITSASCINKIISNKNLRHLKPLEVQWSLRIKDTLGAEILSLIWRLSSGGRFESL